MSDKYLIVSGVWKSVILIPAISLRAKFDENTYGQIFVWLWQMFEFGIFFVQKASCKCWWGQG